jgi:hypothetical protein
MHTEQYLQQPRVPSVRVKATNVATVQNFQFISGKLKFLKPVDVIFK